jgi:hypothetical protein
MYQTGYAGLSDLQHSRQQVLQSEVINPQNGRILLRSEISLNWLKRRKELLEQLLYEGQVAWPGSQAELRPCWHDYRFLPNRKGTTHLIKGPLISAVAQARTFPLDALPHWNHYPCQYLARGHCCYRTVDPLPGRFVLIRPICS